jgi:beta-N-acetylhexosaminidase
MRSLERDAASLFCMGFPGPTPSAELRELVARGVSSVILFSRNVPGDPAEVAELTRSLKALTPKALGVFVDQEGGKVQRLRQGFTRIPSMRRLGDHGDPELSFRTGLVIGRELRAVGIDATFAPVLDVDTNPNNPVIGERSLSPDPERVAELGSALLRGLLAAGAGACAKHFPGHGDTELDSHLALPRLSHPLERIEAVELVPFRAAIAAGVPAIMTAHVVFAALDPSLPATLSPSALALLRTRLGFEGLIVSDDTEMRALVDHFGLEEAVVRGFAAGLDLFLVCHTASRVEQGIEALVRAVRDGAVPARRIDEARARVERFLSRFAAPADYTPDLGCLRSSEHLALCRAVDPSSES